MRRHARIIEVSESKPELQELVIEIVAAPQNATDYLPGTRCRALSYPLQIGKVDIGQHILTDVEPLALKLGTGGAAIVIASVELPPDQTNADEHVVKARYTPTQHVCHAASDHDSPYHLAALKTKKLVNFPVIVATLHSALPAIIAGIRSQNPQARIAYIHTDWGALPLYLSRTVNALRDAHWVSATITSGQSYGGDYEAMTEAEALVIAREVCACDIAIIAPGPGTVGTGTPYGFTALNAGWALQQATALNATAYLALRMSGADPRARHRGLSHHIETLLSTFSPAQTRVILPELEGDLWQEAAVRLAQLPVQLGYTACPSAQSLFASCPVQLATMGRSWREDPIPFLVTAAAGIAAASEMSKKSGPNGESERAHTKNN